VYKRQVGLLQAGDTVEILGDIEDTFAINASGTSAEPIVVRGISTASGEAMVRPRILLSEDVEHGLVLRGNWLVLENLDISEATSTESFLRGSAVYCSGSQITLRNCLVRNCSQGVYCDSSAGDILIEFCEFDTIGGESEYGSSMHGVYMCPTSPSTATIQHCYFHDAVGGGAFVKSRCRRNVIRYNWFENAYNTCLTLVDTNHVLDNAAEWKLYPMHSDIVANVFSLGWTPGPQTAIVTLGGESELAAGTEGDFNLASNLFIVTKRLSTPCLRVPGNVRRVSLYNNVFFSHGVNDCALWLRDGEWQSPRTELFKSAHGDNTPVVEGAGNWLSDKVRSDGMPSRLFLKRRGVDPVWTDFFGFDFHPTPSSPLVGAAVEPIPKGASADLLPEYEPMRGIPPDLRPRPRPRANPPSCGPFEVR